MPSLLVQALQKQSTPRPPLWLMRQAGRYLPEYMEIRAHQPDFLAFCYNPAAATAVTLQPVYRFNLDAAIIFADILTIPDVLGHKVTFTPQHGPSVEKITTPAQVEKLAPHLPPLTQKLSPVAETIQRTRLTLPTDKAVLGFSGAPWTLATYLLDDKPSRGVPNTLKFAADHPAAFAQLIATLTDAVVAYLSMQLKAGADAVQVFDSWAVACPPELWQQAVHQPLITIVQCLREKSPAPVILFPRGADQTQLLALAQQLSGTAAALSLSQDVDLKWACSALQPHVAIQGNLDPRLLTLDDPEPLKQAAIAAIQLGQQQPGFVLNLGHGLTPDTRLERVNELSQLVQNWSGR